MSHITSKLIISFFFFLLVCVCVCVLFLHEATVLSGLHPRNSEVSTELICLTVVCLHSFRSGAEQGSVSHRALRWRRVRPLDCVSAPVAPNGRESTSPEKNGQINQVIHLKSSGC